jgi:hypothetical protein
MLEFLVLLEPLLPFGQIEEVFRSVLRPKQIRRGKVHPNSLEEWKDIDSLPICSQSLQNGKQSLRQNYRRENGNIGRLLEVRLGVDSTQHAFLAGVGTIMDHTNQVVRMEIEKQFAVERMLLKGARVDDAKTMQGIDAQFIRRKPNDRTVLAVQSVNGEHLVASLANALNPSAGEGGGEVCIGDFGERGDEERADYILEQRE